MNQDKAIWNRPDFKVRADHMTFGRTVKSPAKRWQRKNKMCLKQIFDGLGLWRNPKKLTRQPFSHSGRKAQMSHCCVPGRELYEHGESDKSLSLDRLSDWSATEKSLNVDDEWKCCLHLPDGAKTQLPMTSNVALLLLIRSRSLTT